MKEKPLVVSIVGQTGTGKTDFSIQLAQKLKERNITVEVISADSRQVYKDINLLSGKVTKKEMSGIPHHLLDVAHPKEIFTVSDYTQLAKQIIKEIIDRGNIPLIVGGTGFYIDALVNGITIPEVPPNNTLRKKLEKLSADELFILLQKKDKSRASEIDKKNKVRLIRALEIVESIGKVPKIKKKKEYTTLKIGLIVPDEILKEKIKIRITKRIQQGMLLEAKKLHKNGVTYERLESLGLECKYASFYLQKKITKNDLIEQLATATWQYAKRQKTWFKRDQEIEWITL